MVQLRTIIVAAAFLAVFVQGERAHAQTCVGFGQTKHTGNVEHDAIDEASGLAASWRHEGLYWLHNDSGDKPRLFLMAEDGAHVATVTLAGVDARDWEDVAVGPCDKGSEESCVYVADIGDNRAKRKKVAIYRFAEPALGDERPADITVEDVTANWFTYPGGARDAETVMVHPKSAKIYVVEKTAERDAGVYRIANKAHPPKKPVLAVEVGQLRFGAQSGFGKMITAGDIAPDGSEFTVRTYLAAYTFCVGEDAADFESAVKTKPVVSNPPFMIQSETLGYGRGGNTIWITTERRPAPVYRMQRNGADAKKSDDSSSDN
ncbi:hypothetical protein FIV42_24115 [Persicimonas caeni]|uniref:Uncharacterized protein n=1 Tax=Persicimonas caeni TaxID=2292766 RepID=A0A4Y6Q155_PERCE|nr:hypothetical protein [Persicimonas caeni]QDG53715.1 hypothetical protein FIV42_24115 [Persicimonas caeni]QED34936.1 hypothetical protein FRD00_24110 [Persicimonas caeni]